jgi:hypothetical protein
MEENKINIVQVDPQTFEFQQYSEQDNILISSSRLDTAFTSSTDYIEYYAYDESKNLIYPNVGDAKAIPVTNFSVINGDTLLYPAENLSELGYDEGTFYATYNFYRKRLASDISTNYYISEISSDRTELRLNSNVIPSELIISSSGVFIEFRATQDYFVDFLLNFGNDQQVIANNLRLDTTTAVEPSLLVKLYEPLPSQFGLKSTLWVVEEISYPEAYSVTFPPFVFESNDIQFIKGPNYSIIATQETGESGQLFSYDTLIGTDITSSQNQLKNLLNRKDINISVDYSEYSNFIHFSSAYTRLDNFYYKVGLIQSSSLSIEALPLNSGTYSASKAELSISIEKIISNFDGWEYFMYFNSGSAKSYPKQNTEPPYILFPTGSVEALTWVGSTDDSSAYYGGQAVTASDYDADNPDYLFNAIPEYLREDSENAKYELFVDMVAQQYDNTWLYTKNLTTRFDADNRLDFGISKDLVADAIRDFGVKLYSNNFNTNDLYTAFLGITPSGSTFPFPDMTGSYPAPSGFEYVNTTISASNDIVPLDNVNKSLYKRIYHNIPYLLKTKGTIAGIRALITAYGIPSTILRINEFGGKDRLNNKDWDYSEDVFNYALHLDGNSYMSSSFIINSDFQYVDSAPKSLQFRFKTPGIPTSSAYYNVWVGDQTRAFITLEYTGSGMGSGSYSGSSPSQSNAFGTLKFWPDGLLAGNNTASIDLPFFDGGWWSVQATVDYNPVSPEGEKAVLYAANRIYDQIGFSGSDEATYNWQYWANTSIGYLPSASNLLIGAQNYSPLTGALQEVRYWDVPLSESLFFDYVMNPYSTQGNTINSTPDDLVFRADLGTQLITASRTSIHPKVTGSWEITQSFADGSSNYFVTGSFITNREEIFLNQVPGGIKNRITDKIKIVDEILPTGSTLSPFRSIQQSSYRQGSDPNTNYLEVAFSPTDQVNDDIIAQIGAFNLGDYIGDPRQISESGYSYPQLDQLRDEYFTKYINSYDVNDFIRLIKFFDNSLFKMIKDFTPARTSLSSGIVIKQNLLERNRQAPPSASYTTPTYSGSVKSFPRDYQVPNSNKRVIANNNQESLASSSFPPYSTVSGSSIYVFSGGTGGVFEPFNNNFAAPISESNSTICIENYFYSSSINILEPNANSGEFLLTNIDATNTTNTMSLSTLGTDLQNHSQLMALVSSSTAGQVNYVKVSSNNDPNNYMLWRIDRGIYYGGYGFGDSDYGGAPYGDFTSQYQFYVTVEENGLDVNARNYPSFTDKEILNICFTIAGSPYSGLTANEISASSFFAQYPDFVQSWSESFVPGKGIGMPNELYDINSNGLSAVNYPRIDQREFYNGEFGNPINVGINDICSAFFGQNDLPDYFYRIQWLNHSTYAEELFLPSSNIPLAGEVWFWADTVNVLGQLSINANVNISQQPNINQSANTTTNSFNLVGNQYSNSGNGTGGSLKLICTQVKPFKVQFTTPGSGYATGDIITIPVATLQALGIANITRDLIITLRTGDVAYQCTNTVKYIKMSNVDVNGETIIPFIQNSSYVEFSLTGASDYLNNLIEGYQTWYIANSTYQDDNDPDTEDATLLIINQPPSSRAVSSYDTQFYDLTFSASGQYSYYATSSGEDPNVTPTLGITQSVAQGFYPPVPTFPTESFFRGWGESNYYQTNANGSVFRVGAGSGFSSDTNGNFNTGSYEIDNDPSIPYTASKGPWFMNAKPATTMALSASSLLGGLNQNSLQFYTGSITASAVQIGPWFKELSTAAAIDSGISGVPNSGPPPLSLVVNCGNVNSQIPFPAAQGPARPVVINTNINQDWRVDKYSDTNSTSWINVNQTQGSDDTTIYVNAASGVCPENPCTSPPLTRSGWITISLIDANGDILTDSFNNPYSLTCSLSQTYYSGGGGGGGGQQDVQNPFDLPNQ